jgi:O-antigen/teichoic acid export membrane protein
MGKKAFPEKDIKTAITQIWAFTTLFSIIVCFCLMRYFSTSGSNLLWVILAVLPIPFTLFNTYNTGIFLGKNQIRTYNKINWMPKVFAFGALVVFLIVFSFGISGALAASVIGPLLMFFLLLFKNRFINSFSLNFNWKIIKAMLSLGIVYALALLIINLNYKVDIILLDKLSTSYYTGIYSKGQNIADFLWEIPMLLSTIVFARSASAKDGLQYSKKVAQLLRLSIIFIGLGSILLVLLAKYVILLMYGEKFTPSTAVIQLLMPGVLLLTIYKVLNMDLAGKGKPWISMKAMIPAVILNILLNILLIPKYNANGSAVASTISYTFAAILFLYFYSKEVGIPIKEILRYSRKDFLPIVDLWRKCKR